MHALIDADRLAYAFGGMKDDNGYPVEWQFIVERIESNLNNILQSVRPVSFTLYLTSDDKSNFRYRVATIRPYKGHRPSDKPFWYEQIRRHLIANYPTEVASGMEADDLLGITQSHNTVICSVDKDLNNIPGLHYDELKSEKGVYEVSELDADRNFFCQLLTGDRTDNIPGLYGVGTSSKLLGVVRGCTEWNDMYLAVKAEYEKRFGSYWKLFMFENAQLLYILRTNNTREVIDRFEETELRVG